MINDSIGNNTANLENINSLSTNGVQLNGTDQCVDLGSNVIDLGGKFSFETVVKTSDTTNNSTVMCLSDRLSPNISWDFRQNITSGRIYSKEGNYANFQSASGRGSANNVNVTLTESNGFSAGTGSSFVDLEPFEIGGSFSIEIYFKLSSTVNANGRIFQLSKNSHDYAHNAITFERLGANANFTLSLYDGSGNILGTHSNRSFTPSTSEWSHVVFTVSSTEVKCYLNGSTTNGFIDSTLTTSVPYSEYGVNRNAYVLGGRQEMNNTTFTQGEVADIKYFNVWQNKTLTQSEVYQLYNSRDMTYANKLELTMSDTINLSMTNANSGVSFRKIKVMRVANQIYGSNQIYMMIGEVQMFVDGSNIIPNLDNSNFTASSTNSGFDAWLVKDENINLGSPAPRFCWHSSISTDNSVVQSEWLLITLENNYNTNNLQSIVVYAPTASDQSARNKMMNGCVIQLLDENDNIVYTTPTVNNSDGTHQYFRLDGGDIANATLVNSGSTSTTSVINTTIVENTNKWSVLTSVSSIKTINSGTPFSNDQFYHIIGSVDNDNDLLEMYVDGTLAGSTSVTPFDANTTFEYNYLGKNELNTNLFNGTIGYFNAWNYDLTSTEVTNAYDSLEIIPEATKITFNKVRFLRTSLNGVNERFECSDLQIWMNVDGVITNVASDGTGIISRTGLLRASNFQLDETNDGILNDAAHDTFISETTNISVTVGDFWGLEFNEELSINNLAAVVYYKIYTYGDSSSTTNKVIPGVSFQLLKDDDILYTREITNSDLNNNAHTEMVKFHGPALPLDYVFATSDSTTNIREGFNSTTNTRYFLIDNINSYTINQIKYQEFNDLIFSSDFRRMISSENIFDTTYNWVNYTYDTDHLLFNHEGLNLKHNNDYLRMDPINYGGDCSFEFYVSLTSGEDSEDSEDNYEGTGTRILASATSTSNSWRSPKSFMIKTNGTDMEFYLDDDGDTPYFDINNFFDANTFTHVVITFDITNNEIKIYKDGTLNTTDIPGDNSKFTSDFEKTLRYIQFGRDFDESVTRNMKMKYFRIYDKVLSSYSISELNSTKDVISYYGSNPMTQVQYGTLGTNVLSGSSNTHNAIVETPLWGLSLLGNAMTNSAGLRQGGPIYKCVGTGKYSDYVAIHGGTAEIINMTFFNITSDGNYDHIRRGYVTRGTMTLETFIQKLNDTNDTTYTIEGISDGSDLNFKDTGEYYRLSAIITEIPYEPN